LNIPEFSLDPPADNRNYHGDCACCGREILTGDDVFRDDLTHRFLCHKCYIVGTYFESNFVCDECGQKINPKVADEGAIRLESGHCLCKYCKENVFGSLDWNEMEI
jgi:hypothetical protein